MGRCDLGASSAVVTGGASGIGAAVCRRLAEAGAFVVVADVQTDLGTQIAREVGGVFAYVDVTESEAIAAAVDLAVGAAPLRVCVSSAGIGWGQRVIGRDGTMAAAHQMDAFHRVLAVNLAGTFDVTRQAATAMSRNEPDEDDQRGVIVNIASIAAFDGQVGQSAYAASKAAVVGMTLPLARDLAASGIRVNTVAPGATATPIFESGPDPEAIRARLESAVVFPHRLARPAEVARLVVECVGNGYMNGAVIRIDGALRQPPR